MPNANASQTSTLQANSEVVQEILRAIEQLRFGSIEITVHEGRVTQIERREKVRFNQPPAQDTQRFTPTANAAARL
ncbi:MAG TPA: YezD family protein [Methylophilaceae bacterium]